MVHQPMNVSVCVQYQFWLSFFCSICSVYFCSISSHHCVSAQVSVPMVFFFIALEQYFKIHKIINKYKINIHTHIISVFHSILYPCGFFYGSVLLICCIWSYLSYCSSWYTVSSLCYAMLLLSLLSSCSLITTGCYLSLRIHFVLSYVCIK